ncbi:MAG: caspase family protein [Proteobacteria bacterium]|nr:caspase family protein [Pseudomonadota bacterium]
MSAPCIALTIPEFELPAGSSVTITNDYEKQRRVRESKDRQQTGSESSLWIRNLIHVDKNKRLSKHDEWILWVPLHKTRSDDKASSSQSYETAVLDGIQVRYYFEDEQIVLASVKEGELLSLTAEQRSMVESIARGNSYFESITMLASAFDYTPGSGQGLDADTIKKYLSGQDSATITLNSTKLMWERELAEFEIRTSTNSNREHCTYFFWVLVGSGRPVQLSVECKLEFKKDDVSYHAFTYLSRAYSYSDLSVSTIAPEPLPALQPNGDILGMEFSDKTGQLAILTREMGSDQSWLSFWDLHQRKALITIRQAGSELKMTDDQNGIYVFDEETRIINSQRLVGNSYKPFGQVVSPEFESERSVKSSSLIGLYPISINLENEFELWNPGYNKISYRKAFMHSAPEQISAARDGRLATIDSSGKLYLHHLSVDVSGCNADIDASFCDYPTVDFKESKDEIVTIQADFLPDSPDGEPAVISEIELHSSRPIVKFCTSIPVVCGVINYSTGEQWLTGSTSALFAGQDKILVDHGVFRLDDGSFTRFGQFSSYSAGAALSENHHLLFNYQPNYDGNYTDKEIIVRSSDDGSIIDRIVRQTYPVVDIDSPDENTLVFITGDMAGGQGYLLDLENLDLQKLAIDRSITEVESNGEFLLLGSNDFSIVVPVSRPTDVIQLDFPITDFVLLSEYLVYARDHSIFQLSLNDKTSKELYTFDSPVHEIEVFDSTGEQLVARLNHGVFTLPHLDKTLELPYAGGASKAMAFDPQSNSFFVSGLYGYSAVFNPAIEVIQRFSTRGVPTMEMSPRWGETRSMAVATNGELWSATNDGGIIIRDIESGLVKEEYSAHSASITKIHQLDKNTMVTAASDGTLKMWRLDIPAGKYRNSEQGVLYDTFIRRDIGKRNPKLLSTVVTDKEGDFIISSPDGYYWSTPRAIHQASFLNGDELFDFSRYDYWLNRPDIILDRLGKGSDESLKLWRKMVQFRQRRQTGVAERMPFDRTFPTLVVGGPDEIFIDGKLDLHYNADLLQENRGSLHVKINEVPIFGSGGLAVTGVPGRLQLDLVPGINKIKLHVKTADGIQSETHFLTYNTPTSSEKPDLYLLTIGVSNYADDSLDLNYASKDARDIRDLLSDSDYYNRVYAKSLLDTDVTSEAVIEARTFLQAGKPTDHAIVFFAGHGFLDEENNYYFGTTDIDPANPAGNGLAYEEINNILDGIPALSKLLMLDTCHSGEVTRAAKNTKLAAGVSARGIKLKSKPRKGADLSLSFDMLQKAFTDLRVSTGATVISAAGGQEYALETSEIKNGVFTASVIKALRGRAADSNNDGRVSTAELRKYTYDEVSRLTGGQQKPTTRSYNLDFDFTVY